MYSWTQGRESREQMAPGKVTRGGQLLSWSVHERTPEGGADLRSGVARSRWANGSLPLFLCRSSRSAARMSFRSSKFVVWSSCRGNGHCISGACPSLPSASPQATRANIPSCPELLHPQWPSAHRHSGGPAPLGLCPLESARCR